MCVGIAVPDPGPAGFLRQHRKAIYPKNLGNERWEIACFPEDSREVLLSHGSRKTAARRVLLSHDLSTGMWPGCTGVRVLVGRSDGRLSNG